MKKLLLVGSDSVHTSTFLNLVKLYFDDVAIVSNGTIKGFQGSTLKVSFSLRNPLNVFSTIRNIRSFIKKEKPTVIHVLQANSISWLTIRANKRVGIPIIITALGSDILLTSKQSMLVKSMINYNLHHATAFTADAHFVVNEMKRLATPKAIDATFANFGISIPIYSGAKENLIYSNRLHKPLYRIDAIIAAFENFITNPLYKDWKLVIAGAGEETSRLKKLIERISGNVEFVGWVGAEMNTHYYRHAKIFVSVPESDATSISLLEAMASSCIPIVSDLPPNREWITNGENGIVTRSLTGNDFVSALQLKYEKVTRKNHSLIQQHGTIEANQKKFFTLYDKLIQ